MSGGKNSFLKQREERDRQYFNAGMSTGIQLASDFIQMALRDPEVMGKDTFGKKRLEKVFAKCHELDDHYHVAFSGSVDADYVQEELDANLREIHGEELVPFDKRYPYVKQFGYMKARKGWV